MKDKDLLQSFGKHLRNLRKQRGLSQEQFANDADIAISQVSRIERGVINPTLCSLHVMAKALNVKIEKLLEFEVDRYEV